MHILMYHQVTAGEPQNVHTVTARQLHDQLQWLVDHGFRSARLATTAWDSAEKQVALTFDDAYVDFLEIALPILQQFNFHSTAFVISSLVGKTRTWADGSDRSQPPLMNWEQIHACRQSGVDIGSHTTTHPDLSTLSEAEINSELNTSRRTLAEQLNEPIDLLCYPYGRQNAAVRRAARQAGYTLACASRPFFVGKAQFNPYALDRIAMLASDTLDDFAAKMHAPLARRLQWYRWQLRQRVRRSNQR